MTTANVAPAPAAEGSASKPLINGQAHFLLRRLHSLTGVVFGLYIMVHLLVNATLIQGYTEGNSQTVFQVQVAKIHALPFLLLVEWSAIYLPILFHTVYGLLLTFKAQQNVTQYPYGKNIFYFFQRLTAILLVGFIFFHVTAMKGWYGSTLRFDPNNATQSVMTHLSASFIIGWVIYPLGVLAGCYHLANGFWTAAISWGLTISAKSQRRWGYVCVGIFIFTFLCGMTALVGAMSNAALAHHG